MSKFTERKKMSLVSVVISIIFVSMIALSCGGGGGGDSGSFSPTTGIQDIFPSSEDSMSVPIEVSKILLNDVEIEVASSEVIAIFEHTATRNDYFELMNYLNSKGYEIIGQIPKMGLVQIFVGSDLAIVNELKILEEMPFIETAFSNIFSQSQTLDQCPIPGHQFQGKDPHGGVENSCLRHINARKAWEITTGCPNLSIGIIDTYVDSEHQALKNNNIINLSLPHLKDHHGTSVAAIAGAKGETGAYQELYGVAMSCQIYSYDVFRGASGKFKRGKDLTDIGSVLFAGKVLIDNGVKVINISIGLPSSTDIPTSAWMFQDFRHSLTPLVELASVEDVLIVISSGNANYNKDNAWLPFYGRKNNKYWETNAILVAQSWDTHQLADCVTGDVVQIAAPTGYMNFINKNGEIDQRLLGGTSLAAPQVSGAAALIWSLNPNLNAKTVKQILIDTGHRNASIPILDVYAALLDERVGYIPDDGNVVDPGISTENLVGYYPFSGNSNDLSGNGNHGTVHNAVLTEDRYGTPNSAYNFTGSSYIEISNTEPFKLTDEITISAWVRSTVNTGSINQRIISFAPWGGQNGFDLFLWSAMGSIFNFSYGLQYATAPTAINYHTWYFVTGVGGPNGVKLYVNGELVAENQNPPSGFNYSGPLYIGRMPNGSDYWRGQIDEIRVYNRALSQNEVIDLFENNLDPVVSINVTAPTADTQWQRGTTQTIRWASSGSVGNVQLQLRDNSGNYSVIANSVANTGSYNWAIPANGVIGSGFQIRVSDVNKWGTIYDHSDSFSLTSGLPDTTPQPIIVLSNISPQDDNTYLGCPYVDDNIRTVQVTVTVKYNIPEDAPLEKYFLLIRNTFVGSSHFFVQPNDYTPIEVSPGDSGETTITFTVRYYGVYSDCYYYGRNGKFYIYIYFSDRKGPFTIYDSGLEHNAFSEHGVIEYKSRGY